VLHRIASSVGPGGIVDKAEQYLITSKVAAGDNFGTVSIIDTTRKIVIDRFKIPSLNGRRILSISSATIEWVGT
jgi:hypothetical protein